MFLNLISLLEYTRMFLNLTLCSLMFIEHVGHYLGVKITFYKVFISAT